MSVWTTMIVCGMVTFALRLSFIAAEGRVTFPRWFRVLLPFVPVGHLDRAGGAGTAAAPGRAVAVLEQRAAGGRLGRHRHRRRHP